MSLEDFLGCVTEKPLIWFFYKKPFSIKLNKHNALEKLGIGSVFYDLHNSDNVNIGVFCKGRLPREWYWATATDGKYVNSPESAIKALYFST